MKKITFLLLSVFIAGFSFSAKAQISEADYVKKWKFPIAPYYHVGSYRTYQPYEHKQMWATEVPDYAFDPSATNLNFNKYWNSIPTMPNNGNAVIKRAVPGNDPNAKGGNDFVGEIRAMYDDQAVYVLLKAKDDNFTGRETFELMYAPYFKVDALLAQYPDTASMAYVRYSDLGAYKAHVGLVSLDKAFDESLTGGMTIAYVAAENRFVIDYSSATNPILKSGVIGWNHTAQGADSLKVVFQINYDALRGDPNGPRFEYNKNIWGAAEHVDSQGDGKKYYGFTFDIKVNDADDGDIYVKDQNGGDYWWNSSDNEGYATNFFTGFIGKDGPPTSVKRVDAEPVFGNVTKDRIEFLMPVDVNVYSTLGKLIRSAKNTQTVDLSSLEKGIYLVSAKGQTIKVIR